MKEVTEKLRITRIKQDCLECMKKVHRKDEKYEEKIMNLEVEISRIRQENEKNKSIDQSSFWE